MGNFDKAINFVLDSEGYQDYAVPGDSGGLTIWGLDEKDDPNEVVQLKAIIANANGNLTLAQANTKVYAATVYKTRYWDIWATKYDMDLDSLDDWKMALALFDTGVNQGVQTAFNIYQGTDGSFNEFIIARIAAYAKICNNKSDDKQFLLGWVNRVINLYQLPV